MSERPVVRRRLDTEPEPDTGGRSGCLWLGGILGVVAGVLFTIFVMPPLLGAIFPPERVAAGETFDHEGLRIAVTSVARGEADGAPAWLVSFAATPTKSWRVRYDDFHLELADGTTIDTGRDERLPLEPLGRETRFTVAFALPAGNESRPERLVLDVPQVEFELPPPTGAAP